MRAGDALLNELDLDGAFMAKPSEEDQRRLEENRRRRDAQSQQMSELLLKGWTMLGEHCPVTNEVPLMQQPKTGRKFSVAVNKFVDELEDAEPAAERGGIRSPQVLTSAASFVSSACAATTAAAASPTPTPPPPLPSAAVSHAPRATSILSSARSPSPGQPKGGDSSAPGTPAGVAARSSSTSAVARSGSGSARGSRFPVSQPPVTIAAAVQPTPAPTAPSSIGATAPSDAVEQLDESLDAAIADVCAALECYRLRLREGPPPADARDTLHLIGACAEALASLRTARQGGGA